MSEIPEEDQMEPTQLQHVFSLLGEMHIKNAISRIMELEQEVAKWQSRAYDPAWALVRCECCGGWFDDVMPDCEVSVCKQCFDLTEAAKDGE